MGGVYLGEGKNGVSIVKRRKKWGEYTLGMKKMGEYTLEAEAPPQGVFGTFPYFGFIYFIRPKSLNAKANKF